MNVNAWHIDNAYMNTMMFFEDLGYKLEFVKKVSRIEEKVYWIELKLDIYLYRYLKGCYLFIWQLMMLTEFMESWALYVFDPENKHMLVMDPATTFDGADVMCAKHETNAKKVLYGLAR
jgi:hypothetical protein